MNLEDLKQQENCPLHGKRTPCQSCQDIMNKTYGMETPKEKNYFDTSCQKCGHVPQGERHLCNWETPKENWRDELHKIWSNATALIEIEELIESLLLTQRQERLSRQDLTTPYIVGFKEGKEEARQEIVEIVKNHDVLYVTAETLQKCILMDISDLSHRIEERYKHNN